jgi:hypothetical protein
LSYVKNAIGDVERERADADRKLIPNAKTQLASGYRPELDTPPELGSKQLNYFQGLIGILRWICELGRIDILMPVSILYERANSPLLRSIMPRIRKRNLQQKCGQAR